MIEITQNFYRAKTRMTIHQWFTTLCLTVALWMGTIVQVKAQSGSVTTSSPWATTQTLNGGTANEFTISLGGGAALSSKKTCAATVNASVPSISSSNTHYLEGTVPLAAGTTIEKITFSVSNNATGASVITNYVYYCTEATFNINNVLGYTPFTYIGSDLACTPNTITFPVGVKSFRMYRNAKVSGSGPYTVESGTAQGASTTFNFNDISVWVKQSCTPATISGNATTSIGSTTTLSPSTGGGTWSSSNTGIATVDPSSGVVTGMGVGTATITYTLSGCPATKDVTVLGEAKYFRSKTNGVWSAAGTWEVSDDGSTGWAAATNAPDANAKGVEIASGTTVTLGANLTTPLPTVNTIIQVNGTLAASTFTLTLGGDMSVNAGGTLSLAGTAAGQLVTTGKVLTVLGALTNTNTSITSVASSAATLLFATASGAGLYNLNGAAVQIPAATWSNGVYYGTAKVSTSAATPTYSTAAGTYGNIEFAGTASPVKPFAAANNGITFRNFTITSGTYQMTTGAGPVTVNVTGNLTQTAGTFTQGGYAVTTTLNVGGDFALNGGTYQYATATSNINIQGNLIVANTTGLTLYAPVTANTITVNSGTLTVKSGTTLTVQNGVVNNAGSNGIVIENNANLVQVNNVANTGNVTVKRNSSALSRLDYTLWSSPVASQNLAAFSPLTSLSPNRFYTYNTAANLYAETADPTVTNFTTGAGYLIRMPNTAVTAPATETFNGQFTGVPNNGDIPVTMTDGGAGFRFNLVGNPYPSPISMSAFVADNANITGTLYFWRKTNGTGTAYCTWASGTFVSNGNAQAVDPAGIIQTGQGFIVEANGSGTALTFKNTQRSNNTTGQFFRTKQTAVADKVWLNAVNAAGDFSQTAVTYSADGTTGADAFDGKYINDSAFALTSNINNEEYTIQGRPSFDASDVVPLNFKTAAAGDYTISIDHAEGVFATGQDVYLVDSTTGAETNLKSGSYTFTAPAGTANSRFSLKYQKTLGVNDAVFNDNSVAVYRSKGIVYVNSGSAIIGNVKVYDIQGRLLAELKDVKSASASVNNLKAVNQVLVVKVTTEDGTVVTKKVVN